MSSALFNRDTVSMVEVKEQRLRVRIKKRLFKVHSGPSLVAECAQFHLCINIIFKSYR